MCTLTDSICVARQEYRLLRLIPLSSIHACSPIELKKHSFTFGIVTPQRTYYVQASSAQEVADWCGTVARAQEEIQARRTIGSLDVTPIPTPGQLHTTATQYHLEIPPTAAIPIPAPSPERLAPVPSYTVSASLSPTTAALLSPSSLAAPSSLSSSVATSNPSPSQQQHAFSPTSYSYSTTSSTAVTLPSSTSTQGPPTPRVPPNSFTYAGLGLYGNQRLGVDVESLDEGLTRARRMNYNAAEAASASSIPEGGADVHAVGVEYFTSSPSGRPGVAGGRSLSFSSNGAGGVVSFSEEEGDDVGSDAGPSPPLRRPSATTFAPLPDTAARIQGAAVADPNKIILSGYLMKQGKRRNWRKRWFVLSSGRLVYSRSHMVCCPRSALQNAGTHLVSQFV